MIGTKTIAAESRTYIAETFQMAWPAVLESFFVALAGMIDSLMVSSIGAYAVAAVGLTTQPKFIGLAMFIAMNVAIAAIVARRKGQEDWYGANQTVLVALAFVVVMGILVSSLCVAFADSIIHLCGSNTETHDSAVLYFQIIMGGMIFNIISLALNAAQRGAGRTRIAMKTNVTANVINMLGNYLLIGGKFGFPALGIRGAALALIGRSLGEERPELAKTYGAICQRMGNLMSLVLAGIYLVGGRGLYQLYFKEPEIVDMGVMIMRVVVVIVILQVSQVIYMGCLRGAGDVLFTTVASTISVTVVRTFASWFFCYALGLGVIGIWLGVVSDQFCRFMLTRWRFRSGVWTKVKI